LPTSSDKKLKLNKGEIWQELPWQQNEVNFCDEFIYQ